MKINKDYLKDRIDLIHTVSQYTNIDTNWLASKLFDLDISTMAKQEIRRDKLNKILTRINSKHVSKM